MSKRLNGYDLVAALTENAINAQFRVLWGTSVIKNQWTATFKAFGQTAALDVTQMGAPYVSFSSSDSDYRSLLLILPLKAGTLEVGGTRVAIENWTFAFETNVSDAPLSLKDLEARVDAGTTPKKVQTAIEGVKTHIVRRAGLHAESPFDVRHLFMDFQNANFAAFNERHTSVDLSGLPEGERDDAKAGLVNALTHYFHELAGSQNPYVLGYSVKPKATVLRAREKALPVFVPATVDLSTTASEKGLGTLNFLFTIAGTPRPDLRTAGIFSIPWVTSNDVDGVFAADDDLLMAELIPPLMSPFGDFKLGDFRHDGDRYKLGERAVEKGELKGGTLEAAIHTQDGQPTMQVDFTYRMTKVNKAFDFIPLNKVHMTATWQVVFEFKTDDAGVINGKIKSVTKQDPTFDVENQWYEILLKFFPVVLIADLITTPQILKSFPNVNDGAWDAGAVQLGVVMPAGDVLLFKRSRFDAAQNLLVDVTINT